MVKLQTGEDADKITAVVCMSTNKDEDNANGVAYSNIMTRMRQDACFTAWGKNNR